MGWKRSFQRVAGGFLILLPMMVVLTLMGTHTSWWLPFATVLLMLVTFGITALGFHLWEQ